MVDEWGTRPGSRRNPPTSSSPSSTPSEVQETAEQSSQTPERKLAPPMMNGVPLTQWTDCGRYTLLGSVMGLFVGIGAGGVDTFVKSRSRNLSRQGILQLLYRTMVSRSLACGGFFTLYQTALCSMRWKQLNQDSEISNVLVAGAAAFTPFMVAGRGNTFAPYFMLLVGMDAFDQYKHDSQG